MNLGSRRWAGWLVCAALAVAAVGPAGATIRQEQPVVVEGSQVPMLNGLEIARMGLFRYQAASGTFEPIPFQIDQRVLQYFPGSGSVVPVTTLIHDVLREDDGLLDGNDELAFMFKDVGDRAAEEKPGPAGADSLRYEIHVMDPRSGAPVPEGWVYLFTGDGLATSPVSYVSWGGLNTDPMSSDLMELGYDGNWKLTEYRVLAGCGSGADLLDRLKARAGSAPDAGESEEVWNQSSTYLGAGLPGEERGLVGPVRAIRYVRGAASGANTIHYDIFYRKLWVRHVDLRVHSVPNVWHYLDWLPVPGLTMYTPTQTAGTPLDGSPDGPVYAPLEAWNLIRSPEGGGVRIYDVPPSPFVMQIEHYYVDDASFDDAPPNPPVYPDDDDQAIGNHGFRLGGLSSSSADTIPWTLELWTLCADEGDAALGAAYRQLWDVPLQVATLPQGETRGPIQTLQLEMDFSDVLLSWQPVVDAKWYRVYYAPDPTLPLGYWGLLDEGRATQAVDAGASAGPDRYYSVLAVTPDQREMVDLSMLKNVDDLGPAVGDDVTFAVTVRNARKVIGATGVTVWDLLPDGFAYVSDDSASTGTAYDPVSGIWDVGTIGSDETRTLHVTATVLPGGNYLNEAEVIAADQPDLNDVYDDGAGLDYAALEVVPGSVRTLRITRVGNDLVLEWSPVSGAIAYRVYANPTPGDPKTTWTMLSQVPTTQFVDTGAVTLPENRNYSVVAVTASGEGPH